MKRCTPYGILLIFFIGLPSLSSAQQKYSCKSGDVAFDGYDLVSYREGKEAVKGSKEFTYEYDGLILYFRSDESRSKFKSDPERFMPEYGGWCATAMALGHLNKPDYNMFTIENNKLYFFEVRAFFNGRTQWAKAPEKNREKADQNYQKELSKDQ